MALVIQDTISVAANTRNSDVLSGKRNALIEATSGGAVITFYCNGSAVGLFVELFVGQRNSVERSGVNSINRYPVVPDDMLASNIAGLPNERITMPLENTTGGAITAFYRIEVEELPRRR